MKKITNSEQPNLTVVPKCHTNWVWVRRSTFSDECVDKVRLLRRSHIPVTKHSRYEEVEPICDKMMTISEGQTSLLQAGGVFGRSGFISRKSSSLQAVNFYCHETKMFATCLTLHGMVFMDMFLLLFPGGFFKVLRNII